MTKENKDPLSEHDAIARRAHELFVGRGGEHGHHEDDWLQAEDELRNRSGRESDPDYAVSVESDAKGHTEVKDAEQASPKQTAA